MVISYSLNLPISISMQKSSAGNAELFAGRGEKGGLLVLLNDEAMIAAMTLAVAQIRYSRSVNYFTVGRRAGGNRS